MVMGTPSAFGKQLRGTCPEELSLCPGTMGSSGLTLLPLGGSPQEGGAALSVEGASFPGTRTLGSPAFKAPYFTPKDCSFYDFSFTGQRGSEVRHPPGGLSSLLGAEGQSRCRGAEERMTAALSPEPPEWHRV